MSKRKRRPSEVQLKALAFIKAHPKGFTCTHFAKHLWDTRTWQAHAIGKTGGAYLWRLCSMGLIALSPSQDEEYLLTEEGLRRLREAGREL